MAVRKETPPKPDPTQVQIASLSEERRGYVNRKTSAEEEGNSELAKAMDERIAGVDAVLASLGVKVERPRARRTEEPAEA